MPNKKILAPVLQVDEATVVAETIFGAPNNGLLLNVTFDIVVVSEFVIIVLVVFNGIPVKRELNEELVVVLVVAVLIF